MKRHFPRFVIVLLIAHVASPASALVTPVGYWRLGEHDLGAIPNDPCLPFTIAAAGGSNLARQGTLDVNNAFYIDDVSSAAAPWSRLGIRFDNTIPPNPVRYFTPTDPCLSCPGNFGIEMWVRSGGAQPDGGLGVIAYGQDNLGRIGYGFVQSGNSYQAIIGGDGLALTVGSVPVTADWVHLALVVEGGFTDGPVTKFYVDGALHSSVSDAPPPAVQGFGIGGYSDTAFLPAMHGFYGSVDEARLFTFERGQFSPSDLLVNQPAVPEPASLLLLLFAIAGFAALPRNRVAAKKSSLKSASRCASVVRAISKLVPT